MDKFTQLSEQTTIIHVLLAILLVIAYVILNVTNHGMAADSIREILLIVISSWVTLKVPVNFNNNNNKESEPK